MASCNDPCRECLTREEIIDLINEILPTFEEPEPGTPGTDGTGTAFTVEELLVGDPDCPEGGQRVTIGRDTDGDGIPDDSLNTFVLCQGAAGSSDPFKVTAANEDPEVSGQFSEVDPGDVLRFISPDGSIIIERDGTNPADIELHFSSLDQKVRVSATDTVSEFLAQQIDGREGVILVNTNSPGNEKLFVELGQEESKKVTLPSTFTKSRFVDLRQIPTPTIAHGFGMFSGANLNSITINPSVVYSVTAPVSPSNASVILGGISHGMEPLARSSAILAGSTNILGGSSSDDTADAAIIGGTSNAGSGFGLLIAGSNISQTPIALSNLLHSSIISSSSCFIGEDQTTPEIPNSTFSFVRRSSLIASDNSSINGVVSTVTTNSFIAAGNNLVIQNSSRTAIIGGIDFLLSTVTNLVAVPQVALFRTPYATVFKIDEEDPINDDYLLVAKPIRTTGNVFYGPVINPIAYYKIELLHRSLLPGGGTPTPGTDELVKSTVTDTGAGFLNNELEVDNGLVKEIDTASFDEFLVLNIGKKGGNVGDTFPNNSNSAAFKTFRYINQNKQAFGLTSYTANGPAGIAGGGASKTGAIALGGLDIFAITSPYSAIISSTDNCVVSSLETNSSGNIILGSRRCYLDVPTGSNGHGFSIISSAFSEIFAAGGGTSARIGQGFILGGDGHYLFPKNGSGIIGGTGFFQTGAPPYNAPINWPTKYQDAFITMDRSYVIGGDFRAANEPNIILPTSPLGPLVDQVAVPHLTLFYEPVTDEELVDFLVWDDQTGEVKKRSSTGGGGGGFSDGRQGLVADTSNGTMSFGDEDIITSVAPINTVNNGSIDGYRFIESSRGGIYVGEWKSTGGTLTLNGDNNIILGGHGQSGSEPTINISPNSNHNFIFGNGATIGAGGSTTDENIVLLGGGIQNQVNKGIALLGGIIAANSNAAISVGKAIVKNPGFFSNIIIPGNFHLLPPIGFGGVILEGETTLAGLLTLDDITDERTVTSSGSIVWGANTTLGRGNFCYVFGTGHRIDVALAGGVEDILNTFVTGFGHTVNANSFRAAVVGGQANDILPGAGTVIRNSVIVGGHDNNITSIDEDIDSGGIFVSKTCVLQTPAQSLGSRGVAAIMASIDCTLDWSTVSVIPADSPIVCAIISSMACTIQRSRRSVIVGSLNSTLGSASPSIVVADCGIYSCFAGVVENGTNSVLIGGGSNSVNGLDTIIAGGGGNKVFGNGGDPLNAQKAFILGGTNNEILLSTTVGVPTNSSGIVGGINNSLSGGTASAIVAGENNNIGFASLHTDHSVIAGGVSNRIEGSEVSVSYSFIGGGNQGVINATQAGIIGGNNNSILEQGISSFIGGGSTNEITFGLQSAIIGGLANKIQITGGIAAGFIGGGRSNHVAAGDSAIVGGDGNIIVSGSRRKMFIGGGATNSILADESGIIGGQSNIISGTNRSFIGGGIFNTISSVGVGITDSAIIGGSSHTISGPLSGIVGGRENTIDSIYSAIIGGEESTIPNGINRTVMLACNNFSADKGDCVFVPRIDAIGFASLGGRYHVDGIPGTDFSGSISSITIVGGIVTAAS